ncbi:MAG: hypothetical protein M0R80_17165 [Proteobacteria bacterium]|jgi:prophage antirepressor-like protein|nr:hypothetical protein [Pseudomonadota bacterium]
MKKQGADHTRSASAQARRSVDDDDSSSLSKTVRLTLLSGKGLYKVLMLTRQPAGDRMRDWLAAEVLPQIARDGRPHWIAKQVGAALGYSDDGGELARMISKDWADEFTDKDRRVLRGAKLKEFKGLIEPDEDSSSSHAPSLVLLTESGVTLAAVLSKKPAGKVLGHGVGRHTDHDLVPRRRCGMSTRLEP